MQVSDLMQRIDFTMPKFKDHEKGNKYDFQPPRKGFENKDRIFFVKFLNFNLYREKSVLSLQAFSVTSWFYMTNEGVFEQLARLALRYQVSGPSCSKAD